LRYGNPCRTKEGDFGGGGKFALCFAERGDYKGKKQKEKKKATGKACPPGENPKNT